MDDIAQSNNRFAPPRTNVEDIDASDGPQLATRGQRFAGALIDGLFALALSLAIMLPMYGLSYARMMGQSKLSVLPGLVGYLGIFYVVQGWFIYQRSQSLGKMAMGVRIVRTDGGPASFGRAFGLRLFLFGLAGFVPFIGPFFGFIDCLFIFGAPRRCLHDYVADTIVVTATSSQAGAAMPART
ncbi:RDD family protein [Scleromatobacter humisilvae]|uniref:RDD family protein n=1 Tax=Scleromatobacter humisilvae TaxID=2897159 RepID=A0A9X1YLP9_9BURK|nr:RDD family protein [Scleromatobacter humisilvae]MCK9688271.1 RDD family protein [Scleromatobacter humisilvae]